jgi:glycosyltransferase involved in cell wall biosynthesis
MKISKPINLVIITKDYPNMCAGSKRVHHLIKNDSYLTKSNTLVISYRSNSNLQESNGVFDDISYRRIGSNMKLDLFLFVKIIYYQFVLVLIIWELKKKFKNILVSYGPIDLENVLVILFAKILRYKIVFDIVEDYTATDDKINLYSRFRIYFTRHLNFLYKYLSDGIIVISDNLKEKFVVQNCNVIKICVTAEKNTTIKESNSHFTVTYAGSFAVKDNVELIILSFINFNIRHPNSRLLLIGHGGIADELIWKYQNNESILFLGFVEDDEYYSLLKNSDVLCMCRNNSKYSNAGFPFKLGEYLYTSNPVIVSKVSDVTYYLDDNSAFLIEPDNFEQTVDAMIKIFNNPELASRIGANGYNVARKNFDRKLNSDLFYNFIEKL